MCFSEGSEQLQSNAETALGFYTKSTCSCWTSTLGQSTPQTVLKSFSAGVAYRKSMHLRQKTHKRVEASWWTLASVRSAVYLKQAAPGSSWIRTLAVHFELLIETGNCVTACQSQVLLLDILWSDEGRIPMQPTAVLVTCAYRTFSSIKRWAVEAKGDVCFWRSRARALSFLDVLGFIWIRSP